MTGHRDGGVVPPVRRAPIRLDAGLGVLAAVLAVSALVGVDVSTVDPALHRPGVLAVALTAIGAAATAWRRSRPLSGLLVVTTAATAVSALGQFTGILPYLTMAAVYAVAAYGGRREAVVGLLLVVGCFVGLYLAGVPDLSSGDVATSAAVCVAAAAIGDAARQRRTHQLDAMAAAEVRAELATQRAVVEERLRIARDIHDVVAHSMSLIAVQAGVGAHLLRRDPPAAERALDVIADTSRDALTQLRSVVGLLRSGEADPPSPPGLVALDALVDGVREAGLTVDVQRVGAGRPLPATVDVAAYRVVQEALTNAVRHAPDVPVTVRVTYTPSGVVLEVTAHGTTGAAGRPDPGYGLVEIRERARAVGGSLHAGTVPGGGFRVSAELPTGAST